MNPVPYRESKNKGITAICRPGFVYPWLEVRGNIFIQFHIK